MIFVTGCARSGTSLTASILKNLGCNTGKLNDLYENTGIRENVLKPYLRSVGADPLGQEPLPDTDNLPAMPDLRKMVQQHIPNLEPWMYKDAKLTLVWPVWAREFPEAKWVLVRRDKSEIAKSCLRTPFMRAYEGQPGWERWVEEHEKRFEKMKQEIDLIEVWPSRVMEEPESFSSVAEHCGLSFRPEVVSELTDRSKWHGG